LVKVIPYFTSAFNKYNLLLYDTACHGYDAAVWFATGFSNAPEASLLGKVTTSIGSALAPNQSIDMTGIPDLAHAPSTPNDESP